MDKKASEYFEKLSGEQKEICLKLRKILLSLKVDEDMQWGVPSYGGRYYIYAGKKGVNLGVSVKGMKKEDMVLLRGKSNVTRRLEFTSVEEINEKEVKKILKKAGGCVEC